jgi:hypothetical protein
MARCFLCERPIVKNRLAATRATRLRRTQVGSRNSRIAGGEDATAFGYECLEAVGIRPRPVSANANSRARA